MEYYRQRLNYFVNGGVEPRRPSQIVGCQLIPQSNYNNKTYIKIPSKKYEPKTRTYKPEETETRKFNINKRNENDYENKDEFMRNPFREDPGSNMFKNFFGNDFFNDDDDFFGFDNKLNQTQKINNNNYHTYNIS